MTVESTEEEMITTHNPEKEPETEGEVKPVKSDFTLNSRKRFFIWHRPGFLSDEKVAQSLICDMCGRDNYSEESELKLHQLKTHINPFYLNPDDQAVVVKGESSCSDAGIPNNLKPNDSVDFSGLFRCHQCPDLFDARQELRTHLDNHEKILAMEKAMRSEDFEDVVKRKARNSFTLLKDGKENKKMGLETKKRKQRSLVSSQDSKRLKGANSESGVMMEPSDFVDASSQKEGRPKRRSKTTANTLVALSLADEVLDINFEDDQSSSSSDSDNDEPHIVEEEEEKEKASELRENVKIETEGDGYESEDDKPLKKPRQQQQQEQQKNECTSTGKSSPETIIHVSRRGRGRPRKTAVKNEKQTDRSVTLSNGKRSRGRPRKDSSLMKKMKERKNHVQKSETPIEDILPDLMDRPPPKKTITTKRSVTEAERISQIVRNATEHDPQFWCLGCEQTFDSFKTLQIHKLKSDSPHCQNKNRVNIGSSSRNRSTSLTTTRRKMQYESADPEYSGFISSAIRSVPEATFNNMHGRLQDIDSETGILCRTKDLGTLDKVRLNVSEFWSTKNVWESGGWEPGKDILSWHKFESCWSEKRSFLKRMSGMSWPEQRNFRRVFDNAVSFKAKRRRGYSSSSDSESCGLRSPGRGSGNGISRLSHNQKMALVPDSLGLKQKGKSVKQMSNSERNRKRNATTKEEPEVRFEGELNGEWELDHLFMCTVCAETYDEVREVMHHKWDAHPYAVVTHVTLQDKLHLPPCTSIYPQLGFQLRSEDEVWSSHRRRKYTSTPSNSSAQTAGLNANQNLQCTKCNFSAEATNEFHKHVLVCGGDELWEQTSKKKKKKLKKNVNGISKKKIENKEEAAEKKKARFARFNVPPPTALETGRMTRLQAVIIKKTKSINRIKNRKGKRGRKPGQKNATKTNKQPNEETSVVEGQAVKMKKKKRKSLSIDAGPSDRPRRSSVSYARLRDNNWHFNERTDDGNNVIAEKQNLSISGHNAIELHQEKTVLQQENSLSNSHAVNDLDKVERKNGGPKKENASSDVECSDLQQTFENSCDLKSPHSLFDTAKNVMDEISKFDQFPEMTEEPKTGRGRPRSKPVNYSEDQDNMMEDFQELVDSIDSVETSNESPTTAKPGRGRPKKPQQNVEETEKQVSSLKNQDEKFKIKDNGVKPGRGRPRKERGGVSTVGEGSGKKVKAVRGRPKKDLSSNGSNHLLKPKQNRGRPKGKLSGRKKSDERERLTLEGPRKESGEESFDKSFKVGRGRPSTKRRASVAGIEQNGIPKKIKSIDNPRLSLDSRRDKEELRPLTPFDKQEMLIEADGKKTPGRPKKDDQSKPSDRRKCDDESEESDSSSGSGGLVPNKRLCNRNNVNICNGGRVVFPKQVKIDTIQRIASGVPQVQVARDLQCPLSTVTSWWQKRRFICPESFPPGAPATVKSIEQEEVKYPIVPYRRNEILSTMKQRVEEAFKHKDSVMEMSSSTNETNFLKPKNQTEETVARSEEQPFFEDEEIGNGIDSGLHQENEIRSESRASSGLSMILENYGEEGDNGLS